MAVQIKRENVFLTIDENLLPEFTAQGYEVVKENKPIADKKTSAKKSVKKEA